MVEPAAPSGLRILFIKERLAWPRSSGHDVHCYYMMRALAGLGHSVGLLTAAEPAPEAVAGLPLALRHTFPAAGQSVSGPDPRLTRLQERFRVYWGIDLNRLREVGRVVEEFRADAVVVVGLNVLPYLGAVHGPLRVWYAADEWAWHHLSQLRLFRPGTWSNAREAVMKGLYERAYAPLLDRVWVVSEADQRAMRWVAGVRGLDVLPNGVDGEHFAPRGLPEQDQTCTFWGRLDFGPNVQALEWFCDHVWPDLLRRAPEARFTIYGFKPGSAVQTLAARPRVTLVPDLADLRPEISRHQVVVLPFVSGGGIKNKLLEAAGLGKAFVATPVACRGLRLGNQTPFLVCKDRLEWVEAVLALWADPDLRLRLGRAARQWVLEHHSWRSAARDAVFGLERAARGHER